MVKVTKVNINYDKCVGCGFCETTIACANPANCVGCLACYWGCPYEAREIVYVNVDKYVRIEVNGVEYEVPEGITVAKALEIIGLPLNPPGSRNPSLACGTGGCWACAILIDGEFRRACTTPVREGQRISLNIRGYVPRRIVHGPAPHTVGGKATPWWEVDYLHYVEAAMWLAGCNLRCPQCIPEFEKVFVRINGKPTLITMGELFNRLTKERKTSYYFKPVEKVEVLSFNPKTFKVEWTPVTGLIRRYCKEPILKITTKTNRVIFVSPDHLMVVVSEKGLDVKKACELKIGDMLLAPKRIPVTRAKEERIEIDLIEEFSNTGLENRIWVKGVRDLILKHAKLLSKKEVGKRLWKKVLTVKKLGEKLGGDAWYWYKMDRMPLKAYLKLEHDKSYRRKVMVGVKFNKTGWIPAIIPVNKDFLRFLGYYLSEGCTNDECVRISFSINEKDLAEEVSGIVERLFKLKPKIYVQKWKGKDNVLVVSVYSKALVLFLTKVLNIGTNSYNKRVPDIVYSLPSELVRELIDAYFMGDGSLHWSSRKRKKTIYAHAWTSSKELMYGLDILLLMCNVATRFAHVNSGHMIFVQGGKNLLTFSKFSRLFRRKNISVNSISIGLSCSEKIPGNIPKSIAKLLKNGDLYAVTVKRIEKVPYEGYLYDFEVQHWSRPYRNFMHGLSVFTHNCQNFEVTYDGRSRALTPEEAAKEIVLCHREYGTKGIAVSGGEPTLNRDWLIMFFKEVTRRVHERVRRHLDSNGTLLTPDYIDELVEAGCNNIGVEPKCVSVETYMKITGLKDRSLAEKYLNTAWKAIEYLNENYLDKVYIGIGLVYNRELVTLDEIAKAGEKIASINPYLQVTVLDYFPAFRRRTLRRPSPTEMVKVKRILEDTGLKTVIVQTSIGHIGPGK